MELTVKQILQSAYKKSSIVIITVNVTSHTTTYSNGFQFSNGKCFTSCFSSASKKFASVQMTCPIHSEKNGLGRLFRESLSVWTATCKAAIQKILHPLKQLGSSVQKKIILYLFEWLGSKNSSFFGSSFQIKKCSSSVSIARVVCLK